MIITCSKHGRTKADCDVLTAHLFKLENDFVIVAEIGNSAALDVRGALRDMEILRDGSPSGAGLHHITLNPSANCSHEALLHAAHRARREFDPASSRPYVIVIHGKARAEPDSSASHAHVVVGHVDHEGRALKDKFSKIRTERLARELEFDMGERPTLGRHHVAVLRQLRKCRPEAAAWLVKAFGENPEKPISAISSAGRNRAKRMGVNLPEARSEMRKLWQAANDIAAFRPKLAERGFEIAAGQKSGVWIVRDSKTKQIIGALDRLLKLKRLEVEKIMETQDGIRKITETQQQSSVDDRTWKTTVRAVQDHRRADRTPEAASQPLGRGRNRSGDRPHRENRRDFGEHFDRAAKTQRRNSGLQSKARFSDRVFDRKAALVQLRTASIVRLAAILAQRSANPIHEHVAQELPDTININAVDIWGIPIPPPRPRF